MSERRKHFRLAAHLPLDIVLSVLPGKCLRRISSNVSAGGVYFQGHTEDAVHPGQKVGLRIAVPAAVGRLATESVLEGEATVLRVEPLSNGRNATGQVGVACEFNSPLRFA
jgi:hypothetical protein